MTIHAQHRRADRDREERPGLFRPLSRSQLADLLAPIRPSMYAGESVVELRWCGHCGEYMREGSAAAGHCVDCFSPRPADAAGTSRTQ